MDHTIIVMTFEDERNARRALNVLHDLRGKKLYELIDAVVLEKDIDGSVSVTETEDITSGSGMAVGGAAGLIIGALLGGPIGGVLLGVATGAIVGKVVDLGIPDEKIQEVTKALHICTSALLLELKSGDPQQLIDAIAETGGRLYELEVPEAARQEIEAHVSDARAGE